MELQLLDKLAQLRNGVITNKLQAGKLLKKARSKYVTTAIIHPLLSLKSELHNSYQNSLFCANVIVQEGQRLTSHYCNNRWCLVCNRIRTAKLINGYVPALSELPYPYLVTLTIPNVSGDELQDTIRRMGSTIRRIQGRFRKAGHPIVGIRKIECTYNSQLRNYHPHYHLIVSHRASAQRLVSAWLHDNPTSVPDAQNITPADMGSVMELFKYFTKLFVRGSMYPAEVMDTIFRAMYGRRVFQPMGIRKDISEDIERVLSEVYPDIEPAEFRAWLWQDTDWVAADTGGVLSGYVPSVELQRRLYPPGKISPFKGISLHGST